VMSSFVVFLALSSVTPAFAQEAELIAAARRVRAASLDSTQPRVPFERWLAQVSRVPRSAMLRPVIFGARHLGWPQHAFASDPTVRLRKLAEFAK
jgi:hypothetical protein